MASTGTGETRRTQDHAQRRARAVRTGLLVTAAIVVAALIAGLGAWLVSDRDSAQALPPEIQKVYPGVEAAMLRQDQVGVQVTPTWYCNLEIDGVRIPEDQISGAKEIGECYFRPGKGKEIEEFAPGRHEAVVTYFPLADPQSTRSFRFGFEVH